MFMILYKEQIRINIKKSYNWTYTNIKWKIYKKKPDCRIQKCKMCAKDTLEENVIKSSQIKSDENNKRPKRPSKTHDML